MSNCQLSSCCGCVSLRTGSLIIGYMNMIGGLALFIISIIILSTTIERIQQYVYLYWQDIVEIFFAGANVGFMFIGLVFTFGLLYGVHKYQARFIRPYLIYSAIFLMFNVTEFAVSFLLNPTVIDFIINVLVVVLTAYFLLVVRSYWLQLKSDGPPMASGIVFAPQAVQPAGGHTPAAVYPAVYPVQGSIYLSPAYPVTETAVPKVHSQTIVYQQSEEKLPIDPPPYQAV